MEEQWCYNRKHIDIVIKSLPTFCLRCNYHSLRRNVNIVFVRRKYGVSVLGIRRINPSPKPAGNNPQPWQFNRNVDQHVVNCVVGVRFHNISD